MNYHQVTGRPHSGLSNPAKFGLTYEEVVELIETGKWKSFYSAWYQREQRQKGAANRRKWKRVAAAKPRKNKRYRCVSCKRYYLLSVPRVTVKGVISICEHCAKRIVDTK